MATQVAGLHELHDALADFMPDADGYGNSLFPLFDRFASPDVKVHFVGLGFLLARDLDSLEEAKEFFKATFLPAFYSALDTTKPVNSEPVRLIGGGDSELYALEMKGSGTAKNGKPWVNEVVLVVRSNSEGKWAEVKVYIDTLQLQNHMLQTSK
ncbi:hypothetical protein HD806DRAFT_517192 [Xylariaceae sp. AK1471]|nr:hypothetical protein HD806DRAFT_517192 [Xylariaceae sp. AK1471]